MSMHRRFLLPAVGVAILAACSPDFVAPVKAPTSPNLAVSTPADGGDYIVLLRGTAAKGFRDAVARLGGTVTFLHEGAGFAAVSGLTASAATELSTVAGVAELARDTQISLDSRKRVAAADALNVGDPTITSVTNPAGAFAFSWQWNMHLIGADTAWKHGHLGSSAVTVAILDTGIDYDNLDLNGQVDLTRSVSFVASDNALRGTYFPTRDNISDFEGHGTNVATQVSSRAVIFAGVTSRTKLIGVKVLGRTGSGSLGGVLSGVLWAADHGANVANMSLGGSFPKAGLGVILGRFINRTFNYAHQRGMLIVVAAGNALPPDYIPVDLQHNGNEFNTYCDAPHVICVSAVGPTTYDANEDPAFDGDVPAWFSYYGRTVISVAAPGGNYDPVNLPTSAWPWGNDVASWVFSLCTRTQIDHLDASGAPVTTDCARFLYPLGEIGTSQASPHVAGLAALLMAEHGTGNPDAIKRMIEESSDPIDPLYGSGRISVRNALGL